MDLSLGLGINSRRPGGGGGGGGGSSLLTGLEAWWDLPGGDANQVDDSGNGLTLTPQGAPGQNASGAPDGAACADLEASTGQSYRGSNWAGTSPGSGAFGFSVFVTPESLAANLFVISKYQNSGNGEWFLYYDLGLTSYRLLVRSGGSNAVDVRASGVSTGVQHCLQGYIDPVAQEAGLRLNGGAFDTDPLTTAVDSSTAIFAVGERANTSADWWDGLISMCGIWSKAPTTDEFNTLYNSGSGLRHPFS